MDDCKMSYDENLEKYIANKSTKNDDYEIKVVGEKTTYGNGATRCIKSKGRFDLMHSNVLEKLFNHIYSYSNELANVTPDEIVDCVLNKNQIYVDAYKADNNNDYTDIILKLAFYEYFTKDDDNMECVNATKILDNADCDKNYRILTRCVLLMLKELAIHFQKGADKYGERNCEKGIPEWSFRDSGLRHLTQYMLGTKDGENHFISAIWNFWMLEWTILTSKTDTTNADYVTSNILIDPKTDHSCDIKDDVFGINVDTNGCVPK